MGHQAGQRAFGPGDLDHAAADEYRSAWQRDAGERREVQYRKRVFEARLLKIRGNAVYEAASYVSDVRLDVTIMQDWELLANRGCGLATQLDVLGR